MRRFTRITHHLSLSLSLDWLANFFFLFFCFSSFKAPNSPFVFRSAGRGLSDEILRSLDTILVDIEHNRDFSSGLVFLFFYFLLLLIFVQYFLNKWRISAAAALVNSNRPSGLEIESGPASSSRRELVPPPINQTAVLATAVLILNSGPTSSKRRAAFVYIMLML